MEEFRADPVVEPDTARNLLHVGADLFAEIRNFVDECDLRSEERIGRILDELSGPTFGIEYRRLR